MVVPDASLRIDKVLRRPILVVEGAPNEIVAVHGDRIVDPQRFNLTADVVDNLLKSVFRRMDADHDQSLILVFLRPCAKVSLRAQPVDAGVCPEMDEDDFSAQARRRERRRIEPVLRALKRSQFGLPGDLAGGRPRRNGSSPSDAAGCAMLTSSANTAIGAPMPMTSTAATRSLFICIDERLYWIPIDV